MAGGSPAETEMVFLYADTVGGLIDTYDRVLAFHKTHRKDGHAYEQALGLVNLPGLCSAPLNESKIVLASLVVRDLSASVSSVLSTRPAINFILDVREHASALQNLLYLVAKRLGDERRSSRRTTLRTSSSASSSTSPPPTPSSSSTSTSYSSGAVASPSASRCRRWSTTHS